MTISPPQGFGGGGGVEVHDHSDGDNGGDQIEPALVTSPDQDAPTHDFIRANQIAEIGSGSNSINVPGGLWAAGGWAFMTDIGTDAILSFDVRDPLNPTEAQSLGVTNVGNPFGLWVRGDFAYCPGVGSNNIGVVDVSDPSAMSNVTQVSGAASSGPRMCAVSGNALYVGTDSGLGVWDISDPAAPTEVGVFGSAVNSGWVAVSGTRAITQGSFDEEDMQVFDITDPLSPVAQAQVNTGREDRPALRGDVAYLTEGNTDTLETWDISDPANPTRLERNRDAQAVWDVRVVGDFAYINDRLNDIFRCMDVSDPANMREVYAFSPGTASLPRFVEIDRSPRFGPIAYMVTDDSDTFHVIG